MPTRFSLLLVVFGLLTACLPARADDKQLDSQAREVAQQFIQAILDRKLEDQLKVAEVPWFDGLQRTVIKDPAEIKKALQELQELLLDEPPKETPTAGKVLTYRQAREKLRDEKVRKLLDEVLSLDDRVVLLIVEGKAAGTVLVRLRDGKAKVAGLTD